MMVNTREYADRVMVMVRADMAAGLVPATVGSFAQLHDHVDANDYLTQAGVPSGADNGGTQNAVNAVMAEVSRRLASAYEESAGYTFELRDGTGQLRDRFEFYGPFSAGCELASKRAALHDAVTITCYPDTECGEPE